jgi:hypothetical protein
MDQHSHRNSLTELRLCQAAPFGQTGVASGLRERHIALHLDDRNLEYLTFGLNIYLAIKAEMIATAC